MVVSIITPTYNRADHLRTLYRSLRAQTCDAFEWLIVDDGSEDNTAHFIREMQKDAIITIRSWRVPNGGKHRAVNLAVSQARGDLLFIVDSDDIIVPDAVEWIISEWNKVSDKIGTAGIVGLKAHFNGKTVGTPLEAIPDMVDTDLLSYRTVYGMTGDRAEVFRTDVLREFPFPEIEGEKFCPEALVWFRIARKYKMRYLKKIIYLCEYLPDGLTARIVAIRMKSPRATMMSYSELFAYPIPFVSKIKAAVNFYRFSFCGNGDAYSLPTWTRIVIPVAYLFHLNDLKIHSKQQK